MEANRARARLAVALALVATLLGGCSSTQKILPLRQESGEAAKVIRNYREAMERQRAHADFEAEKMRNQKRSLEDLLKQGDQLRDAGNYGHALFAYLRAHTQRNEDIVPRLRIGFLHLREESSRAEAVFRQILAGTPDSMVAWTGLGLAQVAQSRSEEARSSFERAVALDPQAPVPRSLLGVMLDREGRHLEAQEQYQRALAVGPDDHVILNNLGVSHLLSQRPDLAVEVLRRGSFAEPRNSVLRNNLGLALGLEGSYDAALSAFRAAGSEWAAQNNLGWVHYLNGDYAGAISCFEKALDAEGDELLVVLGNIDRARSALERAPRGYVGSQRREPLRSERHGVGDRSPAGERPWAEDPGPVVERPWAPERSSTERRGAEHHRPVVERRWAEDQISVADLRAAMEGEEVAPPTPVPELETALGDPTPDPDEMPLLGDDLDEGEIEFEWEDDFGWLEEPTEPTA